MSIYRTTHSLYLGAELELYVEQHSACAGYWLGVRETEGEAAGIEPAELSSMAAVSLEQLRRAAESLAAVVARLELEEQQ